VSLVSLSRALPLPAAPFVPMAVSNYLILLIRDPPKADMSCALCDVRQVPKADMVQHDCDVRFVPLGDLSRCSTNCGYSITSSARPSSGSRHVTPSALAVLRLSTRYQLDLDGLLDRQISLFVTFEAELLGVVAPVCQMPRRRGGIIRPPLTRAYSRGR
jgi:hypothetical protein